jgi:uncharacterized membrane protein
VNYLFRAGAARYEWIVVHQAGARDAAYMNKRLLSGGLWFLVAAYAGSILHGMAGVNELVGPLVGVATASLIVADPFHRNAIRPVATRRPVSPASGAMQTQI